MKQDLHVTVVQADTHWEQAGANLAELEELLAEAETDLIVFPETFTTGFSSNGPELAETMNLTSHKWMKMMAAKTGAAICGSLFIKEQGKVYNRFLFVKPDGHTYSYNKRHLFSIGAEGEAFSRGNERLIVDWKGWKILPQICYDLRFPVWTRNRNNEYDLLLYVANWPAARNHVWNTLLPARAIENQAFAIGCNRIGVDGNNISYIGESQLIDYKGVVIKKLESQAGSFSSVLSYDALQHFRETFPIWRDADGFTISEDKET